MKLSITLGILAAVNLLSFFFIHAYALFSLGAGGPTDAFYAAQVVPQFFIAILTGPIRGVVLPLLAGVPEDRFRSAAWSAFVATAAFAGITALAFALLAPVWARLLFPGFSVPVLELTAQLGRIQMAGMFFTILNILLSCASQARQKFLRVEAAELVGSGLAVALLVGLFPRHGLLAAAWAAAARSVPTTLFLATTLRPTRLVPLGDVARDLRPLLVGALYTKTGFVVDRVLASWAPPGALSVLHFTEKLYLAGIDLVRRAASIPLLSRMADRAQAQEWPEYRTLCTQGVVRTAAGAAGLFGLALLAAGPAWPLLTGGRILPAEFHELLGSILLFMGGFLLFGSPATFLTLSFYSRKDFRTPTFVGMLIFTVGVVLKIAGFLSFGVRGLACAASLIQLLSLLLLALLLQRSFRKAPTPVAIEPD